VCLGGRSAWIRAHLFLPGGSWSLDSASIPIFQTVSPRTWVNRGKRKDRSLEMPRSSLPLAVRRCYKHSVLPFLWTAVVEPVARPGRGVRSLFRLKPGL
jgi:hypothetical protein